MIEIPAIILYISFIIMNGIAIWFVIRYTHFADNDNFGHYMIMAINFATVLTLWLYIIVTHINENGGIRIV
jgi:hypothetical protein